MRRPSEEAGFSLVELLVTVLLMSMVSFIIFGFLDNTTNVTSRTTRNVTAEDQARVSLRVMTQELRGARPIATTYPSTPSCPTGLSYPDGYKRCVSFEVNRSTLAGQPCPKSIITYGLKADNVLREDRQELDATCTAVAARSYTGRRLMEGVQSSAGPLFRFYDQSGIELTATDAASLPSYAAARSMRVTLSVQYQKDAPNLNLSSVLSLRNNR